jgi:hypothetical protein
MGSAVCLEKIGRGGSGSGKSLDEVLAHVVEDGLRSGRKARDRAVSHEELPEVEDVRRFDNVDQLLLEDRPKSALDQSPAISQGAEEGVAALVKGAREQEKSVESRL